MTFSNGSINEKSLTNIGADTDITWDESTGIWDENLNAWVNPGRPITKGSVNEKILTNLAEYTS